MKKETISVYKIDRRDDHRRFKMGSKSIVSFRVTNKNGWHLYDATNTNKIK